MSGQLIHTVPFLRQRRRGFTLLELLIVIFIIALISSGFVKLMVGFGGAALTLENETKRLYRLLTLTAQEAILEGSGIGVLIEKGAYRFVSPGQKHWVAFEGEDLLQRHQLPQGWRLELQQYGQEVPPVAIAKEQDELESKPEEPAPTIIFYDSGEMTSFQLRIYAADNPAPTLIEAKESGEIEMHLQGVS